MNASWKPTSIPRIVGALRNNVEVGGSGGKGASLSTLKSYGLFAYGLPSGSFYQVKIGGITGSNELRTDPSNIQTAIQEFLHPDTQAPEKATAQVLHRRIGPRHNAPSPKNVSVVVLNGNGVAGSAANTGYLLSQKGYRVGQPPPGFQANAPGRFSRSLRTQIFFSGRARRARLACSLRPRLVQLGEVSPVAPRESDAAHASNGAMLTVVVGQSFTGRLTPTPPDRTPPRQPPNVRPGRSETLPAVRRAAAWKVGFPLQIPTVI